MSRMKKKIIVLIIALCGGALIFGIVAKQSESRSQEDTVQEESVEQSETAFQSETTVSENIINGFELAEYDKFNSPKSENGLGGTKVYLDGIVGSVRYTQTDLTIPGSNCLYLSVVQEDGNEWLLFFGSEPATIRSALEDLSGKTVRVYGIYEGLSIAYSKPVAHIYEEGCCIEDKSTGLRYKSDDLSRNDSSIIAWLDENDCAIYCDEIQRPENALRYCKSFGIVNKIDSYTGELSLNAVCSDGGMKIFTFDTDNRAIVSGSKKIDSLCEGDKVNVYYFIDSANETDLFAIVPVEEPQTFENNKYYEVIESGKFKYGDYTYVVFRVKAKRNAYISSSAIAYDSNGDIIGKWTDGVWLSVGKTNMFYYVFEEDVSMSNIDFSSHLVEDRWLDGNLDAVKMQKWNKKGDKLYITLEQTDDMDTSSELRVLLYKDGKMVGIEEWPFCIKAENLTGVGSTDVMEIWIHRCGFDDIEVAYAAD